MGVLKGKTEVGIGGKSGHSKMEQLETTAELKEASRTRRRLEAKHVIAEEGSESTRVFCRRCGGDWNFPAEPSAEIKQRVLAEADQNAAAAMALLRSVGFDLRSAKGVV